MPLAAGALSVSCAVRAARVAKSHPTAARLSPSAIEPAGGRPLPISASVATMASARSAANATLRAAASPAWRPTTVAPTSSRRPASSSVRVWRMTVRMLANPTIHRTSPAAQMPRAPTLEPYAGPSSMRNAGLLEILAT